MADIVMRFKSYIREDTGPAIGVVAGQMTSELVGSYFVSKFLADKSDDWKLAGKSIINISAGGIFYTIAGRYRGLGNIILKSAAVGTVVNIIKDVLKAKAGLSAEVSAELGASIARDGLSASNFDIKRLGEADPYGEASQVGSKINAGPMPVATKPYGVI